MEPLLWEIEQQKLELKYVWAISRNNSEYKINSFVKVSDGKLSGHGEAAPNIRYSETPELILEQFTVFTTRYDTAVFNSQDAITSLNEFTDFLKDIDLCHALRFAIESAYIHYLCKKYNISLFGLLNIEAPTLPLTTSYSIPIMQPGLIKDFYYDNKLSRFSALKIKVNKEEGVETLKELSKFADCPLYIDGNECWTDVEEVVHFIESLKPFRVSIMEQPMPATLEAEYIYLKKYSAIPLIADESCISNPDMGQLQQQFHGVNMKLMKAGGYLNGLKILREARKRDMLTMIGCMVETTMGIASAMNISNGINYTDLDGFLIIKNEPFGLVKEKNGGLNF